MHWIDFRHFLKLQYHYLLNSVRKKNRFGKWLKADKLEKIEVICKYYGYSIHKAKQVESIFSDNDIAYLQSQMETGGLKE